MSKSAEITLSETMREHGRVAQGRLVKVQMCLLFSSCLHGKLLQRLQVLYCGTL